MEGEKYFGFVYNWVSLIFSFMAGGVLPRGYNYLHISKPEVPIRLDLVLALSDHVSYVIYLFLPFFFFSFHLCWKNAPIQEHA